MDHEENCIMMSFIACILHRMLLGWLNQGGWIGLDMWHDWGGERYLQVLVGRSESKRPLGRPRRRWEDNIKLDFREIGIDGSKCIWLAQDMVQWRAFVKAVMNLLVPLRKHIF
jgi:hypothetical protein